MRICLGLGFSLGIFLITNLFFKYRFIQSFYSSVNVIFKEICQFHLSCQICWWKVFYNITYNFFNFCMFDTDIPFFVLILIIFVLFPLFPPLSVLLNICQFCWCSQRIILWFHWFFSIVSFTCFVFYLTPPTPLPLISALPLEFSLLFSDFLM